MLAYWLLFGLFAAGAVRFATTAAVAAAPGGPRQPQELNRERGVSLLAIAALVPALMIGLRYDVGTDWGAYADIFDQIDRRGLAWGFSRIDPAYALVNWLVSAAGIEFWLVNLVCGLLFMFGLVRFARLQPQPWLAVAVAIPYLVIGVGMGYSRQAVAIGLCMAGLAAISKGSFARFTFWVLAGALFHRSAVVLIPIVAIAYSRNRFQTVMIGLVGCVLGYFVLGGGQGLEHFQRGYISQARESQGAGIRLAMNVPPAVILLAFARRFTNDATEARIWRIFSVIALLSFAAWLLIASTTALDRMALYVIPLQLFVFARLPAALSVPSRPSGLLIVAVVLYSALVQFVWLGFSNNARYWVPYQLYPFS